MRQTGITHNSCDGCAAQTFGAYAMRRVFDNLLTDFHFVLGPIAHD
jgi:hypothetical protein